MIASLWGLDLEALRKGGYFGAFVGNNVPKVVCSVHAMCAQQGFPLLPTSKDPIISCGPCLGQHYMILVIFFYFSSYKGDISSVVRVARY